MLEFDAIIIPGGGVRVGGELPSWSKKRFDRVIEIYQSEFIITLSAGTVHKPPPLDIRGFPIFESVAAAGYLKNRGIEPKKILCETCSYDTIGNAYFSRLLHVDPRNFSRLLIITSDFHMPRTQSIFEWVYKLDNKGRRYQLAFESVPDTGINKNSLLARKKKEQKSLEQFQQTKSKIKSLAELHSWLYTFHTAYAVGGPPLIVTGKVLTSY